MKLRVFTLSYNRTLGKFDDSALQDFFSQGAEAIEVREHFFNCDGEQIWVMLISYRDTSDSMPVKKRSETARRGHDPRQDLSIEEGIRFEAIRSWRNARALSEGKPPYVLLTNRQIAEIATRKPSNITSLGETHGLGEGKLRDFGEELLAVLNATQNPSERELQDEKA